MLRTSLLPLGLVGALALVAIFSGGFERVLHLPPGVAVAAPPLWSSPQHLEEATLDLQAELVTFRADPSSARALELLRAARILHAQQRGQTGLHPDRESGTVDPGEVPNGSAEADPNLLLHAERVAEEVLSEACALRSTRLDSSRPVASPLSLGLVPRELEQR